MSPLSNSSNSTNAIRLAVSIPVLAAGLAIGIFILTILKCAYLTPLRHIPGPWYAKFTNLVLKKHVVQGRRLHYIHYLHQCYGPIIRIAPNEIDVADPEAYKEIHRTGNGFLKDPWYQKFRNGDDVDVFSMIDPKQHSERRKLFAPLWTNSALHKNWENMVVSKVKMAVAKMKRDALVGEADCLKWWHFMTMDVISHLAFGEPLGQLELEATTQYSDDLEKVTKLAGALAELPLLRPILQNLPLKKVRDTFNADKRIRHHGNIAVINAKNGSLKKENVFSRMIEQNEKNTLSDSQVGFEASGFTVAGSGTTAISLTYCVWAVLSHPRVQVTLEEEVAKLQPDFKDEDLERLPYLNASIDETLRMYGAAPGNLPRQPPKNGARLGGYFVPGGTTVSSQAYTLHRDPIVYPGPERFNPSRFINQNGAYEPAKTAWAPFGAGSRTCLGVHLAKMELRHGIAEFFRECQSARIADSMKASEMDILNFFLISPVGGHCCVTLTC